MNLRDRKWKEFKITEVFSCIQRGKRQKAEDRTKGDIAYYSASVENNGLTDFICNPSFIFKNNAIIYSTFGDAYFVPANFSTSDEVTILYSKRLNKYNALFIVQSLKQNQSKYNFGRKAFSNKITKDKIMLPVNSTGEPDYEFMEEYIKERESKLKNKYKNKITACIKSTLQTPNNAVTWKIFKVKNIFPDIEKCKCNNVSVFKEGNIPYVGATNRNNGTIKYIDAPNKFITKGNCIVFICDGQGSIGYSIYKSEDFVGSTTLKIGRNDYLNRYNSQFIISALNKNRDIYSYGYKRTETRLKNETIYLPVNQNGEPDYKFMEDYMKYLEQKKLIEYLDYIK